MIGILCHFIHIRPQCFTAAGTRQVKLRIIPDCINQAVELLESDNAFVCQSQDLIQDQYITFLRHKNFFSKIQTIFNVLDLVFLFPFRKVFIVFRKFLEAEQLDLRFKPFEEIHALSWLSLFQKLY